MRDYIPHRRPPRLTEQRDQYSGSGPDSLHNEVLLAYSSMNESSRARRAVSDGVVGFLIFGIGYSKKLTGTSSNNAEHPLRVDLHLAVYLSSYQFWMGKL